MSQPHATFSRTLAAIVVIAALLAGAHNAAALSDDAVAVLPAAGTESAVIYSLTGSAPNVKAEQVGKRTLVAGELAPSSFTDLKILPKDNNALSDFGDRGVGATDADGELIFSLKAPGERPGIQSVSVVGYDDVSRPERYLLSDDNGQRVEIYDDSADSVIWAKQLVSPPVPAKIVQAIALPDHRIGVAMNWPTEQSGGVDVIDMTGSDAASIELRFSGKKFDGPADTVVEIEDLTELRDLFGLGADELLVTTHDTVLIISMKDQKVVERLRISDHGDLAGEFISARKLDSGHIAVATVEPGLWRRPHPNHRVFWFDDELSKIVARSPSLSRAPWRVEPARGHGGSGTIGLEPDLDFVPQGELDDAVMLGRIEIRPAPARVGGTGNAKVKAKSGVAQPIYLARATISANPGGCDASSGWKQLVDETSLVLRPNEPTSLEGPFHIDSEASPGEWCARLELEGRSGNTRVLSPKRRFSVISGDSDAGTSTGNQVDPVDLDLRSFVDGGLGDAENAFQDTSGSNNGGGCGCHASGGRLPVASFLLLAVFGLAARRRR